MKTFRLKALACLALSAFLSACGGGSSSLAGGGGGGGATPGTLALGAASYTVAQPATSVTVSVTRSGGSSGAVSIQYSTASGTASAGTDYTATSGTLSWADGDAASKTFNISVGTTPFTGTRTFTVTLATPTGSATLGTPAAATVTISGNAVVATPGTLALSAATYGVAQSAGTVALTVTRTGGTSGAVSVQYATGNGTGSAGTDYTAKTGTLNWTDGDAASKTISVTLGATGFTGSRTFTVTLSAVAGGATLGTPAVATVSITGSGTATPGSLALSAASYTVLQSAGSATISVTRTGGTTGAVTVHYATTNGTATAGTDYTATSGTLSWADGDATNKSFSVAIGATGFNGSRTFTVTLSAPTGSATLGTPATATVSITGSGAPAGTLALGAATYAVTQPTATVALTVTRSGGSSGAVTVHYATANGTATAGTDYTAASGTLSWADADVAAKTVSVTIGTTAFTGTKNFTLAISAPTGSATLGTPATATVTITGSGAPGTLALASANATVLQTAGTVALTVNRTGGSSGAVSVLYATGNGTAVAGTDYTATSGTLNWASGDAAAKSIDVPISTTAFTGSRSFTVTLSGAGGGATLGTPAVATVSITGSGGTGGGTTTRNAFAALPAWAGGVGTEWVNGETRLVKDNNPAGTGELFGFFWPATGSSMVLLASSDNGATWRVVSTTASNGCGTNCPFRIIALTQDSTGKAHAIGWTDIADSGHYLRFTLAYTGGHISGFSVDTQGGIALPRHTRAGQELRADIKIVTDGAGNETIAYAVNMVTLSCGQDCDIKVWMGRSTSLTPTSAAQFVNLGGTAGDTLVFDSCTVSACASGGTPAGFSTHTHTALFAQNAASHDLYLFQGPLDADYGIAYPDPTWNTIYYRRLVTAGGNWTVGSLTTMATTTQAGVTAELMTVASGTSYAWIMYVDPARGIRFGRIDAAGTYSENSVTSPDATINRNGWGAFNVSADDTKVWAVWHTLAPVSGGSSRVGEGYWNGATWSLFTDTGPGDAMGMAGTWGWNSGTAGVLFNGTTLAAPESQPTVASIYTQ